jgi:hypothetical protein
VAQIKRTSATRRSAPSNVHSNLFVSDAIPDTRRSPKTSSASSIKTIAGRRSFASRTSLSQEDGLASSSAPVVFRNANPLALASDMAVCVLPVPGGPKNRVVVQIAQASEKSTFPSNLNELKEPSSKSRAQKYL